MTTQNEVILRELLRLLVRDLGLLQKEDAACCGISVTQCHALVEVGRRGQMNLAELSDCLDLDKSTMSRTISSLTESGYVNRTTDSDNRRYVQISLQPEGRAVYESIEEKMNRYYQCIFEAIPQDKRLQVVESIELLLQAVKQSACCRP